MTLRYYHTLLIASETILFNEMGEKFRIFKYGPSSFLQLQTVLVSKPMLDVAKESHCMTMTFAILLGLIFVIELGAGISAYMLRTRVHGIVETNMEKGLLNYKVEGSEGVTQTWDIIQHEVKHAEQQMQTGFFLDAFSANRVCNFAKTLSFCLEF